MLFTGHSPDPPPPEHPKPEPGRSELPWSRSHPLPDPPVATGGLGAVATPLGQRLQPRLAGEDKRETSSLSETAEFLLSHGHRGTGREQLQPKTGKASQTNWL